MVNNVTSYSGNGLRDWLLQRVSAYVLGFYLVFLLCVYFLNPSIDYALWHSLFANIWVKLFTVLALLSLLVHTWIGIWTVITDYVKVTGIRLLKEAIVMLALLTYLVWALVILWSM